MARASNHERERHYFRQFSKAYALPEGRIAYGNKPDIILHDTSIGKIGIEITNFFVKSGNLLESEQRQRPLREKVVSTAHRLYLAGGGNKIELTFGFDESTPIVPAR